jgi:signal transduction histidine kinase
VTVFAETLRALAAPRRAIPIALVCGPMVAAQAHFSHRDARAVALALAMCALFVLVAPASWRWLFPAGGARWGTPASLLAYAVLGALPAVVGALLPAWVGLGDTFLTASVNLLVSTALFWVGGWGLGRDIEQEAGLHRAVADAAAARREAEAARLLALRAHLDPHFLFNTINAIAEWCRVDPLVAERALLDLAALLREVLAGVGAERWPLARELALARSVWALHATRDAERFASTWELPDEFPDVGVPPLILLPLVENAVTHGPARGHRGPLMGRVTAVEGAVVVTLSNPGPLGPPRAGGSGLDTVRRRIQHAEPRAHLEMTSTGGRTTATVTWPVEARG